jgi:arylsulfatase A-like enzyme
MLKKMLLSGGAIVAASSVYAESRPNIIFILADDMGLGDVSGINPEAKVKTPNLDSLMNEGMTFMNAHTNSSVCTPSRYGLMTGRYSWRSKLKGRVLSGYAPSLIPKSRSTVASMLKSKGYNTAMIGKWHLGMDWQKKDGTTFKELKPSVPLKKMDDQIDFTKPIKLGPVQLGFDYFFGISASWNMLPYAFIENDHLLFTKLVQNEGGELPPEPEEIVQAKKNGASKKELKKLIAKYPKRKWETGSKDINIKPTDALPKFAEKTKEYIANYESDKPFFLYLPTPSPHSPVVPSDKFRGTSQAGIYGDYVQETDWFVGTVIKALKDKGIFENTLVVFSTDNGYSTKAFPNAQKDKYKHNPSYIFAGEKTSMKEGGHRVPFIVTWPKVIKPKTTNNDLVSLMDFYATCAELVGYEIPDNAAEDSISFLGELNGSSKSKRTSIAHQNFAGYLGITQGDWKLMYSKRKGAILVNFKKDMEEAKNLINDNPEKAAELKNLLIKIIKDGRSTPGAPQKNDTPNDWSQISFMNE